MKRRIAFVHTSPAAIPPLTDYYKTHAPDFEVSNLLDDGILRSFAQRDELAAEARLLQLCQYAVRNDGAELALVTCSAVTRSLIARLESGAGIRVLKIDDLLARRAIACGPKLGVIVTFPPSKEAAENLLLDTASAEGVPVELTTEVIPEAYDALLSGRLPVHDELLLQAIRRLRESSGAVILSQVSMARVLPMVVDKPGPPVLSALPLSLEAIREALPV